MKNNYEKYIQEVWDMKQRAWEDYQKSGIKSYVDFIHQEVSSMNIDHGSLQKSGH
jgi:hypothetical protein